MKKILILLAVACFQEMAVAQIQTFDIIRYPVLPKWSHLYDETHIQLSKEDKHQNRCTIFIYPSTYSTGKVDMDWELDWEKFITDQFHGIESVPDSVHHHFDVELQKYRAACKTKGWQVHGDMIRYFSLAKPSYALLITHTNKQLKLSFASTIESLAQINWVFAFAQQVSWHLEQRKEVVFDISHFVLGSGFSMDKDMGTVLNIKAEDNKNDFILSLYKSTSTHGSVQDDLAMDWKNLVTNSYQQITVPSDSVKREINTANAHTFKAFEKEGWAVKTEAGVIHQGDVQSWVTLTTFSGYGVRFSVVGNFLNYSGIQRLWKFFESFSLKYHPKLNLDEHRKHGATPAVKKPKQKAKR